MALNIVFAGTPEFSVPSLKALLDHGHTISAVYTQPDRPAGRGRKPRPSAVKQFALDHGLVIHQPTSLAQETQTLLKLKPDLIVVVAYGLILSQKVLGLPMYGCINVHASLLPRWRGAAPIQRAIEAGDSTTGISIMQMDQGLDTGNILLISEISIGDEDTTASLHDKLATLGAECLIQALQQLEQGTLKPIAQNNELACYASKLSKDEAQLDWSKPAIELQRKIRALNPWPVCYCLRQQQRLRIWQASLDDGTKPSAVPGEILQVNKGGIVVQTGVAALRLTCLQAEGGKPLGAREFLNGHNITIGERLE
jgi:methionyl-tRNA formyltransferase